MKAHAQRAGRLDLGRQQVAGSVRVQIQVVGGSRAPRECQLGQTNERADVHGLLVDGSPQWIQRLQPSEQRLVGHRRERAREVLVDVVVRVHQTRGDQTIGGVDVFAGRRNRIGRGADGADATTVDGDPPTGDLATSSVDGGDVHGVANDQVDLSHAGSSSIESRISTR